MRSALQKGDLRFSTGSKYKNWEIVYSLGHSKMNTTDA